MDVAWPTRYNATAPKRIGNYRRRIDRLALPEASGVYRIQCLVSGKCYVGSATNICARVHTHRLDLTAGKHENPYLQNAWALYGLAAFVFGVVCFCSADEMFEAEQREIDERGLFPKGYNVNPLAAKPPATYRPQTFHGFVSPEGERVPITDIKAFCLARGMCPSAMWLVRRGKTKHHHGWTWQASTYRKKQRSDAREHVGFVSPDGAPTVIRNLTAFCIENGLDAPSMKRLARGGSLQHRGWTHEASRRDPRYGRSTVPHVGFIDPSGTPIPIDGLTEFCKQNGLCFSSMYRLKTGQFSQYRGWTYRQPA